MFLNQDLGSGRQKISRDRVPCRKGVQVLTQAR